MGGRSIRWHFFFLGAGFMLLEALVISRMALLFGTIWVVNSIVISVIMLLIVAADISPCGRASDPSFWSPPSSTCAPTSR